MKDVGLRLRVERELREEFVGACRLQGKHAAEVLRTFMRDYVVREGGGMQSSLFQGMDLKATPAPIKTSGRKTR